MHLKLSPYLTSSVHSRRLETPHYYFNTNEIFFNYLVLLNKCE
jgi:hypothetical protein